MRALSWPWLLGFFVLAMLCWGVRPLWDPDEGRYAEASREIVQPLSVQDMTTATLAQPFAWRIDLGKGPDQRTAWGLFQRTPEPNWLLPHLQGMPHLTKPPLTYWITATGIKLLGANEWGARFFLGLAFFATILCVVGIARAWGWNAEYARSAGLIYATSLLPFGAGHVLTTDTFLTLFEVLGILACWRTWQTNSQMWRLTFWGAFGLAFLTKGPPGWLPLIAVAVFAWQYRKRWPYPGRLRSVSGPTLFAIISLAWFLVLCIRQPLLWQNFLGYEVIDRIATTEHKRNNPFFIYIPIVLFGVAPWIGFWPQFFQRMRARLRAGWRALPPEQYFSLLWFAGPYVVFTLSRSRMPLYVLPLCAPVCLWLARLWVRWCGGVSWPVFPNRRRVALPIAIVWGAAMLIFTCYPAPLPPSRTQKLHARDLLKSDPTARYQLFTEDMTNQTLSFYTRRRALWIDRSRDSQIQIIENETAAGRPSALLISKRNYTKAVKAGGKFQVLAKDKADLIIAPVTAAH